MFQLDPLILSELNWLSEELPSRIKVVISCSEDTPVFQHLKSSVKNEGAFLPVTQFTILLLVDIESVFVYLCFQIDDVCKMDLLQGRE